MASTRSPPSGTSGGEVRRVAPVAGPGMEPPDHRDTASDAPGIHGQCLECLRRGATQAGVERRRVPTCHGAACSRACAGHHAVRDWPPHTRLVFQPGVGVAMLALGPRPVRPGVVAVMVVSACVTVRAWAATRRRAARRTVVPGAKRSGAPPVATLRSGVGALDADAVSDRDHHRARMRRLMAGAPRAAAWTVRGVSRRVVVGEACPRDACMRRSVTPAARRGGAQRWRRV